MQLQLLVQGHDGHRRFKKKKKKSSQGEDAISFIVNDDHDGTADTENYYDHTTQHIEMTEPARGQRVEEKQAEPGRRVRS